MSSVGREVLVKYVAQSIPTYGMSCFSLSKTTCKNITSLVANFWWGGDGDKRKIHWRKCSKISHPKCNGGMGFHDLEHFNLAMLGKQVWRLITTPHFLCAKVLKGNTSMIVISFMLNSKGALLILGELS